jgi:hypothetical protein
VTDGAALAGDAAPLYLDHGVVLTQVFCDQEGVGYCPAVGGAGKSLLVGDTVDDDFTGAGHQSYPGYGSLASACAVKIAFLNCFSHLVFLFASPGLSQVRMRLTDIDLELFHPDRPQAVGGQHPLDGFLNHPGGVGLHHFLQAYTF